jgi:hypothetical protein
MIMVIQKSLDDLKTETLENGRSLLSKLKNMVGDSQLGVLLECQFGSVEITKSEIKSLEALIEFHC